MMKFLIDVHLWINWNTNRFETLTLTLLVWNNTLFYCLRFFLQLKKLQERFAKEEELRKEMEEKLTKLMEEKNELFQNLQSVRAHLTMSIQYDCRSGSSLSVRYLMGYNRIG